MRRIRRLLFPPPDSSALRRYLPVGTIAAVIIIILLALPPAWEYSNSAKFCGTSCHTMPPEYNTYLVSPHARVPCVDCHIGRDLIAKQFFRKSGHMRLIIATITNDFEYPIRTSEMRPARDTCERCHFPQKFSDDSLRVIHRFDDDEANTAYDVYLLMHTGGGIAREGLGQGIHWHIENKVEYVALDEVEQDIPWVRVYADDGTSTEYINTESEFDVDELDQYTIREMDCTSCHNRISHLFDTPRRVIDIALSQGDLSSDIPFIRARAIELLSAEYETAEEAHEAFTTLEATYRADYPEFYADNEADVQGAITLLETLYDENTFPEQELDWRTHPNNIGHRDWPGCFRCHDGKHFSVEDEAVRLECNLCHSIPQIVRKGEIEPMLPLTTGIEPSSHLETTWISGHHNELNESCANCHTVENPGGTNDVSFCANSGCHGVDWRYAGFDAPALALELGLEQNAGETDTQIELGTGETLTYQALQPLLEQKCAACHGATPSEGLRVTDYASLMAGSEDGPVIVPNAPDASLIVTVLEDGHFAQLTDEQMLSLRQWIETGAVEGPTTGTVSPGETGMAAGETTEEADDHQEADEDDDEEEEEENDDD